MVVQTLIMMSTMTTMAGIGQSGTRGVESGTSTVQDTGRGNTQDGQADEGLTRWEIEFFISTDIYNLFNFIYYFIHFWHTHFEESHVSWDSNRFAWRETRLCLRYVELNSTDN